MERNKNKCLLIIIINQTICGWYSATMKKNRPKNFSVHFLVIITILRVCTKKEINIQICKLLFVKCMYYRLSPLDVFLLWNCYIQNRYCFWTISFGIISSFFREIYHSWKKVTIRLCFWQKCDFFLHRSYYQGVLTLNVKVVDYLLYLN